ncbi:MAG: Stk1 family PASTA domain-containing Ser/Thr kinase, partial [Hyphomonadaceae bacterium]|nr:Stk1 family PASTA domain-containing Ser/Thr kinase [Clostridia bacterium]
MIGKILDNRYEIIERVGGGGMAVVYKARCKLLNRFVAVKILRSELTDNEEFVKHFHIEAQAAASLSHPNIVSIYDVGHQDDQYYIVMELVEGMTLKEQVIKQGALPIPVALKYAIQIASALAHAHLKNIIHRDVKPHNILITANGVVKVTDFGIARMVTEETVRLGIENIGSVHYLSPEQARGKATDEKSDIYSLGIVLYEMLAGRVPFDGDTPVAVGMKHVTEAPELLSNYRMDIPNVVEIITQKALSKDASDRYATALLMQKDLERALEQVPNQVPQKEYEMEQQTRVVPIVEDRLLKKKPVKTKEDKIAIIAAIVTASLVIIVLTVAIFVKPSNVPNGAETINNGELKVPNIVGETLAEAKDTLGEVGKAGDIKIVKDSEEYSDTYTKGLIISQTPDADKAFKAPTEVHVIVSLGAQKVLMPNVVGKENRAAGLELEKVNIKYETIEEFHDSLPMGVVTRTTPTANMSVPPQDTAKVYISKGKEIKIIRVPELVGKSVTEAKRLISEAGLTLGKETYKEDSAPKETVISSNPTSKSTVDAKESVDLVISSGPKKADIVVTPPAVNYKPIVLQADTKSTKLE